MKFCIPTYKRKRVYTVETLLEHKVKANEIVIATQRFEDFEYMKEVYGSYGITVIYKDGIHNVAGNRNQLLEFCRNEDYIFLLDDDIIYLDLHGFSIDQAIEESINIIKKHNLTFLEWDISRFKKNNELPYVWEGWSYGGGTWLIDVKKFERYDEEFDLCEDTELALRLINKNKKIAYFTKYNFKTNVFGEMSEQKTEGGCADLYAQGKELSYKFLSKLVEKYPKQILKTNIEHKPIIFIWGPYDYYNE